MPSFAACSIPQADHPARHLITPAPTTPTHPYYPHLTTTASGTSTIRRLLLVTKETQSITTRNRPTTTVHTRLSLSYLRFHDQTHLEESQN